MKAILVIAVVAGAMVALSAAAQDERPVAHAVAAVKERIASQCSVARQRLASSTQPFDKEQASVLVKMNCDCLPGEIDRAGADLSGGRESAMTTQAAFLSRLKISANTCLARIARADSAERCESATEADLGVVGVVGKKAYCGCMSEKLNALDDDSITTASVTAHKNFQDKVQARMRGEPDPVARPTVLEDIEKACKQAAK